MIDGEGRVPIEHLAAKMSATQNVTIIGGSLSGLTLALACAHRGIGTRVLEQARGLRRRGGALGIDRAQLLKVIGGETHHDGSCHPFPLLAGRRRAVAWQAVYDWLRGEARRQTAIVLEEGVAVTEIREDVDVVTAVAADGRRFRSRLVVGADGYRSFVRRAIDPGQHHAVYAGYLLWRGLVDETELPSNSLPREHEEAALINEAGHRLVTYAVAGANGGLELGRRLLSFTWYDAGHSDLLRELVCVSGSGRVLRTLTEEHVPAGVRGELCELARRIWPEPWRSVIIHAFERRQVFGTPVAECCPSRLTRGCLAIIGDAAHVVSPVMGKGFINGIKDVGILADCLAQFGNTVPAALAAYERQRLPEAHALVAASEKWSRDFVANWFAAVPTARLDRRISEKIAK